MKEKEHMMTKQDVAEFLKVSTKTVERLVNAGKLHSYKVQTNVRFKKEDVEKYLESIKQ